VSIFSKADQPEEKPRETVNEKKNYPVWLVAATWVIAVLMIALTGFSLYQYFSGKTLFAFLNNSSFRPSSDAQMVSGLPDYSPDKTYESVERSANPDTVLPTGSRSGVVEYQVSEGDSLFGIADEYEVDPETILWANYDILNDDPHLISVGDRLKIPPVDGILYEWQTYDTLDQVAAKYHASVDDVLLYPGNDLDITNPVIEPGTYIMIPNGYRDTKATWVVAVTTGTNSGVTAQIAGPGSCTPPAGTSAHILLSGRRPTTGRYPAMITGADTRPSTPCVTKAIPSLPRIQVWSSTQARSAADTATWWRSTTKTAI